MRTKIFSSQQTKKKNFLLLNYINNIKIYLFVLNHQQASAQFQSLYDRCIVAYENATPDQDSNMGPPMKGRDATTAPQRSVTLKT